MEKIKNFIKNNREHINHFIVLSIFTFIAELYLDFGQISTEDMNFTHYMMYAYLMFIVAIPKFASAIIIFIFYSVFTPFEIQLTFDYFPHTSYYLYLAISAIHIWATSYLFVKAKKERLANKELVPWLLFCIIVLIIIQAIGLQYQGGYKLEFIDPFF